MSYSLQFVKDHFSAEDVVEDVMLQLWEDRLKFEKVSDIKAYLYRLVKNASLAFIKKGENLDLVDESFSELTQDFDFEILNEEVYAVLIDALQNLPEKCKEVFEMSCLEGMKYKDIAEQLNISLNTVKSQRARAIELLKKSLSNNPELMLFLLFLRIF